MSRVREKYSHIQIGLHWLVVLLFGFNFIFGDGMGRIYKAHLRGDEIAMWPGMIHVYVGLAMFWIVVIRMVVRWRMGAPAVPAGGPDWMEAASKWTHRLLYALMLFVPWSGMAAWFGGFEFMTDVHEILINALIVVSVGHALAALYHQFVLKDGLLKRMSFKA